MLENSYTIMDWLNRLVTPAIALAGIANQYIDMMMADDRKQ